MSVRKFDSSDAAVPGVDPASRRTAGTLFASVYGDITPSPLQSSSRHQDAYSLFVQRASALRWLSEDTQRLWSMNDAGWSRPSKPGEKLAAWFQIEAETVPKSDSLPVQPFLHCIDEVLVRAGRHELDAVQLLLPIGGLAASGRLGYEPLPSMQRIFWFDGVDPAARTNIEITLELGPESANAVVLAQLSAILSDLNQRDICGPLFTLDAAFSECSAEGAIQPMFDDSFWNGPPVHRIGTGGTLVEWSLDAIGWFAETLAEVLASLGCTTPVIVTLRRNTPQATELASIQRA